MKKFKCKKCGAKFNVDDNVYSMLTAYCPCCGDIHSNFAINNFDYNKFIEKMKKSNDIYKSDTDAVKKSHNKYNEKDNSPKTISLKEVHKATNKYLFDDVERTTLPTDYKSVDKMVSHPSHYQSKNGIEVIDVIEAFTDGLEGIEAVCAGNAIKYLCRWNKKNGVQDLEKSIWYVQKLINVLKSKNKEE